MSVKDVVEYYKQVEQQYEEMKLALKEEEEFANNNLTSPNFVDSIKETIEPLKSNYMTLSWIMHLLNKPVRQSKQKMYERQTKKFVSKLDVSRNKQSILDENNDVINQVKELRNGTVAE